MTERRNSPRYDLMAQIRVKRGRVNYIMEVRNISSSGLFIATSSLKEIKSVRVGQIVEMDIFDLAELDNIHVSGEIVRIVDSAEPEKNGFGVKFTEMDDATRAKLKSLIRALAESIPGPPPLPQ